MASQIEKMNKRRKTILWITLFGTVAALGVFMYPSVISFYSRIGVRWFHRILPAAMLLWNLVIVVLLLRPRIEKWRSRPSPSLRGGKGISTDLAVVSFVTFVLSTQLIIGRRIGHSARSTRYMELGFYLWIAVCAVMLAVFWLYKNKLKKDPLLRQAVNDERVRQNWLKAYRFGFFAICGITFAHKLYELCSIPNLLVPLWPGLPDVTWLVLFGALISVIGSFLHYNREARDE